MISLLAIILGVLVIVFGFYLFNKEEKSEAVIGGALAIVGLVLALCAILAFLVPGFFM